ncbi:lipopolysaccharide biosynthesis protein [Verrucomicrobiota bacterium]
MPELPDHDQERASRFLHGVMFYGLIATLGAIGIVTAVVLVFQPASFPPRWLALLCLILLLGKLQGTLFAFMYGRNEIARFSVRDLMRSVFRFVFVVVLFRFFGLKGALYGLALNELMLLAVGIWWTRDYLFRRVGRLPFLEFKPYILFGLTFFIPVFLLGILRGSGNLFINALTQSFVQVSYFDIANQFLQLTGSFLSLILAALIPSLTQRYIQKEEGAVQRWLGIVLAYCGIGAFIAVNALVFMGKYVIVLCLGQSFSPVYQNAVIMSCAMVPILVGSAGVNLSILKKEPRVYIQSAVVGAVVMIAFFALLIPKMGAVGASWATVLGYAAAAFVFCLKYRSDFAEILGKFLVVLAVACCVIPFYFVEIGLTGSILMFILTTLACIAALFALKVVNLAHLKTLWQAFRSSSPRSI